MNNTLLNFMVKNQADMWLKENPLLLNSEEKRKFLIDLQNYLQNKSVAIDDEVYDFLVQRKLINTEPREQTFMKYLNKKYGSLKNHNVLDVGAGRICALARSIAEQGGKVTAMDPNIRLNNDIIRKSKIITSRKLFKCDEFSKNGNGTNIDKFDLIVGLEPCDATEHIIRQSLKYDKPFDINLCGAPHKSLTGETFSTYDKWYNHLSDISKEVSIIKNDCGFVATNNENLEL